jgi:adenylate cyclase
MTDDDRPRKEAQSEARSEIRSEARSEAFRRVHDFLIAHGASEDEVARGEAEDVLDLMVADYLLVPPERTYTEGEVAQLTGIPLDLARRFWRALGFPDVSPTDNVFTNLDVEALNTLKSLMELRAADVETALQLARVIGSSMARIADAEVSPAVRGMMTGGVETDTVEAADRFAALADRSLPAMARLLEFVWRRHVQAALRRVMLLRSRGARDAQPTLAVGFADMVGFTVLSQQLAEDELAAVVTRFDQVARDTVTAGHGRVVKMIGDEAMFVAESAEDAARIGLALAEAYSDDDLLSDVRVGLAIGPVLVQDGDYYGPVVNLAKRVVDLAQPGSVLVTDDFHHALVHGAPPLPDPVEVPDGAASRDASATRDAAGARDAAAVLRTAPGSDTAPRSNAPTSSPSTEFEFKALRPRTLKDLGRVQLWVLYRAGSEPPPLERRLGRRWERLAEVLQDLDDLRERGERLIAGTLSGPPLPAARGRSVGRGPQGRDPERSKFE